MDHYDLVYCCVNIDGYEPDLMVWQGTDYVLVWMVPPIKIEYYFQIVKDGEPPFPVWYEDSIKTHDMHQLKEINVPVSNIIDNLVMRKELISSSYFENMIVKPRPPPKNPHLWAKTKTPWDFFKSVFAPY